MSSTSFRSGVYSRPWARPVTRSRAGFFEPGVPLGVPLGVPPPYDGIRAQANERGGGVGVPPPYDGIRAQANQRGGVGGGGVGGGGVGGGVMGGGVGGGVGVPPPYDGIRAQANQRGGGVGGGGLRSRSIFKHDAGYIGYLSDDESVGDEGRGAVRAVWGAGDAVDDAGVVGRRHREIIAQMHGPEISFTHTMFAVVALLMFCVYFVAFIDRMRVHAFNATSMR